MLAHVLLSVAVEEAVAVLRTVVPAAAGWTVYISVEALYAPLDGNVMGTTWRTTFDVRILCKSYPVNRLAQVSTFRIPGARRNGKISAEREGF